MKPLDYLKDKYNLDLSKRIVEIPNVTRLDLIRWIQELEFKVGAEVGTERGEFAKLIAQINRNFFLYTIDPYEKYDEYTENYSEQDFEDIWKDVNRRMQPFHARHKFIRKRSMDALKDFEDESLDFVYIDGNHEGTYPYDDMIGWWDKVKTGGILAGHDFVKITKMKYTIKEGVWKLINEKNIDNLFVLGREESRPNELRERVRSWAVVK